MIIQSLHLTLNAISKVAWHLSLVEIQHRMLSWQGGFIIGVLARWIHNWCNPLIKFGPLPDQFSFVWSSLLPLYASIICLFFPLQLFATFLKEITKTVTFIVLLFHNLVKWQMLNKHVICIANESLPWFFLFSLNTRNRKAPMLESELSLPLWEKVIKALWAFCMAQYMVSVPIVPLMIRISYWIWGAQDTIKIYVLIWALKFWISVNRCWTGAEQFQHFVSELPLFSVNFNG